MPVKVNKEIKQASVKQPVEVKPRVLLDRPDELSSTTYKIKSLDQAFYLSISDIHIDGTYMPYEMFINTKSVEHTAYLTAITRLISAFFRTGYPYHFIAEELKQIHDAKDGNYFKKGVNYPSLIAEIGYVLEKHFQQLTDKNNTK